MQNEVVGRDRCRGPVHEGQEAQRIAWLIERDGLAAARRWARRTAGIYRSAVLDPEHFAHTGTRRRQFIEAYLELKRFAEKGRPRPGSPPEPTGPRP